jgi:hypothetical protein
LFDKEAQDIEDRAATIAAKQVSKRAKHAKGGTSTSSFRNSSYYRGKNRSYGHYQ